MITSADIEAFYNLTLTTEQKDQLDNFIIPALTSFTERYCNRIFTKATYTAEEIDGGDRVVFIKNPPINSVSEIRIDGDAVDSDHYRVLKSYIRFATTPARLDPFLTTSETIIEVDYDGGFDPVPQDVLNGLIKWSYDQMLDAEADASGSGSTDELKRFSAGSVTVEYRDPSATKATSTGGSTSRNVVSAPDYMIDVLQYYRLTPIR